MPTPARTSEKEYQITYLFLEWWRKSPAKSEASKVSSLFVPEYRPLESQCREPSPKAIQSRPHFLGESMLRPHRAEDWSLRHLKLCFLPHSDMGLPKAPRTVTMRKHVRLVPRSCPHYYTRCYCVWGYIARLWGRKMGRGSPGGVQGPNAILHSCSLITGLGG